jgi:hypothetical protein
MTVVLLPPLTGCGRGQSYCDTVRDHQSELGAIASDGDRSGLLAALPIFSDLRDRAPDDVTSDWDLVVDRLRALETALRAADVATTYDPQHPPADLSPDGRAAIRRAAAQLAASDTQQALARVQQEVLDVCHTSLQL